LFQSRPYSSYQQETDDDCLNAVYIRVSSTPPLYSQALGSEQRRIIHLQVKYTDLCTVAEHGSQPPVLLVAARNGLDTDNPTAMSNNPFFRAQQQQPEQQQPPQPAAGSNNPFANTNPFWQAGANPSSSASQGYYTSGTPAATSVGHQDYHPLSPEAPSGPAGRSSVLHHAVSTLPAATSSELTPLRAHYLKKTLLNLEIERELNALADPSLGAAALGRLGPPFLMLDKDGKPIKQSSSAVRNSDPLNPGAGDLPFLGYMFNQFLLPFPFLANAPPTFWYQKVQPFLTSFLAISQTRLSPAVMSLNTDPSGSSTTGTTGEPDLTLLSEDELKEYLERKKLWDKVTKNLAMLFGTGVQLKGGEEVVRIGQKELNRLEEQAEARRRKFREREEKVGTGFDVNVICVRTVTEKGRVRNRSHDVGPLQRA
jgi:hypothetical protein